MVGVWLRVTSLVYLAFGPSGFLFACSSKKNLNETNQLLHRLSFSFSCLCCLVLLVLFRKMISFQFSVALLVTVRFVRFRFWNTQKFVLQSVQTST